MHNVLWLIKKQHEAWRSCQVSVNEQMRAAGEALTMRMSQTGTGHNGADRAATTRKELPKVVKANLRIPATSPRGLGARSAAIVSSGLAKFLASWHMLPADTEMPI